MNDESSAMRTEIVQCGECRAPMVLREGRYGKYWGCTKYPACRGSHGAHQEDGRPLGIPASKGTKTARADVHEAFDTLWKSGEMSRIRAYKWLGEAMGLSKEEVHIGRFTKEQCVRAISLIRMKEVADE